MLYLDSHLEAFLPMIPPQSYSQEGGKKKSDSCGDLNVPTLDLLRHSEVGYLPENVLVPISFNEKNPWGTPRGHRITI